MVAAPKRRRWWLWLPILLLVVALAAWAAVRFTTPGKRAAVGAGYAAHVVCSCRYVGNRDLASCRTDMEPGTEIVTITDDPEKRAVTASVPLLARRTATYDPEYGCALDKP
ncbi:hypothetical protein IP88_04440 [alpha proteobacterium AAP81b]|nr:hypothetical protein IP88_04440 [alpha proteobacterium AAP81b]